MRFRLAAVHFPAKLFAFPVILIVCPQASMRHGMEACVEPKMFFRAEDKLKYLFNSFCNACEEAGWCQYDSQSECFMFDVSCQLVTRIRLLSPLQR